MVALLRLVGSVFEDFRYANEWRDGRTTILFFEARVGDRDLQGIDLLEEGETGGIERFTDDIHAPVLIQKAGQTGTKEGLVVGDQDPGHLCHRLQRH